MTTLSEALRGVMLRDELGDGDRFVLEQAADALENTDLSRGGDSPRQHRTQAGEAPATTPDAALDAEADALRVECGGIFSWGDIGKVVQNDWRAVALKAREMHAKRASASECAKVYFAAHGSYRDGVRAVLEHLGVEVTP